MVTIQNVAGSDTPNAGRVKLNDNDNGLNSDISALTTSLNNHKTSSDHDSRYYTESEVDVKDAAIQLQVTNLDAAAVKLSGAQTVAGKKTLTDDLQVKKASPAIEIFNADESLKTRLYGYDSGSDRVITLQMEKTPGNYENLLMAKKGAALIDSPDRDVYAKGKKLATEEYVQDRLKTGNFVLNAQELMSGLSSTADHYLHSYGGGDLLFALPKSCTLRQILFSRMEDDMTSAKSYNWSTSFVFQNVETDLYVNKFIRPKIAVTLSGGQLFFDLYLYAVKINSDGTLTQTQIFFSNIQQSDPLTSPNNVNFYLGLLFAI
jgi:hypothetical protein